MNGPKPVCTFATKKFSQSRPCKLRDSVIWSATVAERYRDGTIGKTWYRAQFPSCEHQVHRMSVVVRREPDCCPGNRDLAPSDTQRPAIVDHDSPRVAISIYQNIPKASGCRPISILDMGTDDPKYLAGC